MRIELLRSSRHPLHTVIETLSTPISYFLIHLSVWGWPRPLLHSPCWTPCALLQLAEFSFGISSVVLQCIHGLVPMLTGFLPLIYLFLFASCITPPQPLSLEAHRLLFEIYTYTYSETFFLYGTKGAEIGVGIIVPPTCPCQVNLRAIHPSKLVCNVV